jgi:hypothetical protein
MMGFAALYPSYRPYPDFAPLNPGYDDGLFDIVSTQLARNRAARTGLLIFTSPRVRGEGEGASPRF